MIKGRASFGVMKRGNDGLQAMVDTWTRPTTLNLSQYMQSRPQQQDSGLSDAIGNAIGTVGSAWTQRAAKNRALAGVTDPDTVELGGAPSIDLGSGTIQARPAIPMFARGGKLKEGLNVFNEAGPEVAVKDGEDVTVIPLADQQSVDATPPAPTPDAAPDPIKAAILDRISKQQALAGVTNPATVANPAPTPDVSGQIQQRIQPQVNPEMNSLPMAPMARPDAQPYSRPVVNPADKTWDEIQMRESKDWNGADRAPTHNWKDVLKSIALGALSSARNVGGNDNATSALGKLLGGAIGGGVATAVDRNADEKIGNDMALQKLYGDYQRQYGTQQQRKLDQANLARVQSIADWNQARPAIEQNKVNAQMQRAQEVTNRLLQREEFKKGQAQLKTDGEGRMIMVFPNDATKPSKLVLDENNQPITIPGDQAVQFQDPYTGETITLKGKQAAQANTGLAKTNATIEAANQRQTNQQQFTAGQNDLNRKLRVQLQADSQKFGREKATQMAVDGYKKAFMKLNGKQPTPDEVNAYINGVILGGTGEIGMDEPQQ